MPRSRSLSPLKQALLQGEELGDNEFGSDGDAESVGDALDELRGKRLRAARKSRVMRVGSGSSVESDAAEERRRSKPSYVVSDGAVSEDDLLMRSMAKTRGAIQRRLPMIPSRARFPMPSKYGATSKLPRKIPRRVKGKFRRIAAGRNDEEEESARRVAVFCPSNEIDLDEVYAHMLHVRQQLGTASGVLPLHENGFSFETNKTTIVPTIYSESRGHPSPQGGAGRNSVDSPTWSASIFFDVLHLRQGPLRGKESASATELERRDSLDGRRAHLSRLESEQHEEAEHLEEREVFLFGFGCLVFWNWESQEAEEMFVRSMVPFCRNLYEASAAASAADDLEYWYSTESSVKHDTVTLCSSDPVERLAVSFAFAQSSLLSVYEFRLDQIIERNEHIPVALAMHGKIHMSQEEISKEMGRLFMERNMINLESDILGTPEFFWENDEWEPVYKRMCEYMEQDERHDILNKRLDCVRELLDVLASQVENQHASKLEWIIIWLILSEVVVQVVWGVFIKDILGYFNHCGDS